jgi:tetratricopeptide (TPR) repeat protein
LGRTAEGALDFNRGLAIAYQEARTTGNYGFYLNLLGSATNKSDPAPLEVSDVAAVLRGRVAADPNETIARMGLVQMLIIDGKIEEAARASQEIQISPADTTLKGLYLRQRALVELQNKQYDLAVKDFEEILQATPDDVDSRNNYAFMLADSLNRPDDAIRHAQRALNLLQTRSASATRLAAAMPEVLDTLGWAQFKKGDLAQAIVTLRSASKIAPLPSIYYHMAIVIEKQGDLAVAEQTARYGVSLATAAKDPILPDLQKLHERLAKLVAGGPASPVGP